MDIIRRHDSWNSLISKAIKIKPLECANADMALKRWRQYAAQGQVARVQTVGKHLAVTCGVIEPIISQLAKQHGVNFCRQLVQKAVMSHHCSMTKWLTKRRAGVMSHYYDSEMLIFETIERLACLCYAFEQEQLGYPQVLVGTLNTEGPHLDRLAQQLTGFGDAYWSPAVSSACEEYVSDMAEDCLNPTRDVDQMNVWVSE